MRYEDFCKRLELRGRKAIYKNNLVALEVLLKYLEESPEDILLYQTGDSMNDLLYEYFSVKGTEMEDTLTRVLNSYGFDYSMSIHNAIYDLLATEEE